MELISMKVPKEFHSELKKINEETKVPLIYIMMNIWEEYKELKKKDAKKKKKE